MVVGKEDAEKAVELFRTYEDSLRSGPPVVGDVKAWPIALLVSFIVGVPLFLLGRKKTGVQGNDP